MIEVSLYSVPTGSDVNISMGTCIDRARFDKDAMNSSVMDFVKGFLKTNVQSFEVPLGNSDIIGFINNDTPMSTKDFACINYYLAKAGWLVKIWNVTDDEENPTTVPSEIAEWNIIDYNFMQNDYPTAVKIVPGDGMNVVEVLKKAVEQSGLFDSSKMPGIKNPLKEAVESLEKVKNSLGRIEPGFATKIYDIFDQVGVKIFLAVGE